MNISAVHKVNLLLWQSRLLFSEQSLAQSAESLLQDCRQHYSDKTLSHADKQVSVFRIMLVSIQWRLPGDDESIAWAGLNTSSPADLTRGLNTQRRGVCQTVDVSVNADNAGLPVFSTHVHQHHNISKVQISIVRHWKVHLHTWTNMTFATVVFISVLKELKLILPAVKCSAWGGLLSEQ